MTLWSNDHFVGQSLSENGYSLVIWKEVSWSNPTECASCKIIRKGKPKRTKTLVDRIAQEKTQLGMD